MLSCNKSTVIIQAKDTGDIIASSMRRKNKLSLLQLSERKTECSRSIKNGLENNTETWSTYKLMVPLFSESEKKQNFKALKSHTWRIN